MFPAISVTFICLLAITCSALSYYWVLQLAKKYSIVDRPSPRKHQPFPIPVLGGVAVVLGMTAPVILLQPFFPPLQYLFMCSSIIALLIIGTIDDIRGLSVWIRFILEIIIIWIIIWQPNISSPSAHIDSLHGLWNRSVISPYSAIPLTIVAGVGILNSINLIDGIDGYSSGFGIIANLLFSIIFYFSGNYAQCFFAIVVAVSLIPFYLHNVFGQKSKMYLGDGGSLVIGIIIVWHVFTMLSSSSTCSVLEQSGIGLVALAVAILAIPIFDAIRVMLTRLYHGGSPFLPDQTHLHHLFLDMHFSHRASSTCIIFMNLLIVAIWYVSYIWGASISLQFYIVIILAFSCTFVFYACMRKCQHNRNNIWQTMCQLGDSISLPNRKLPKVIEKIVDLAY